MSRKKLIPESITRTEERPLSGKDLHLLKTRRNKQILLLLSGYAPFIAVGIYMLMAGPASVPTRSRLGRELVLDEDDKQRIWTLVPYFVAFVFILLNIYFGKLYFQSLRPLLKDIRENRKQALFFKPEKNPMDVFNKYYLSTPVFDLQQIQVSKEDFYSIGDGGDICLEIAPHSAFILRFLSGEREITVLNNY